ncbi:hypothetical protein NIES2100_24710 [Calothrix sp. NIES-2100]|nr:hypothetical protein NIES2100_24710 [Calothrix sp. NIES-2100]
MKHRNHQCPMTPLATLREAAPRLQAGKPFRQFLLGETTPLAPLGETPRPQWLPKIGLPHQRSGSPIPNPPFPK